MLSSKITATRPSLRSPAMTGPVVPGPVVAGPVVAGPVVAGPAATGPVVVGSAMIAALLPVDRGFHVAPGHEPRGVGRPGRRDGRLPFRAPLGGGQPDIAEPQRVAAQGQQPFEQGR